MKTIVIDDNKKKDFSKIKKALNLVIYIFLYAIILIFVSLLFKKTFILDHSYFGLWALLASVIIYILNKTIKPVLFFLTLPITGITLGLFYPFINVFIIKIAAFLLGDHFVTHGFFILFFAAILISIMNFLMENIIIKPMFRKED